MSLSILALAYSNNNVYSMMWCVNGESWLSDYRSDWFIGYKE